MSEQSPKGGERIQHVVGRQGAVDAVGEHPVHGGHPAHHVVLHVPPHQEEIRRRQHGDRDPGTRDRPRELVQPVHRHRRELGHVADGDPPLVPEPFGEPADVVDVQLVVVGAEVEVHVDVHVELARHLEHPVNLPLRVGVRVGGGTDHPAPPLQTLHHELVGAGVVEQPFLREHADLEIDGPPVLVDERQDPLQAPQSDDRVHLEVGTHVGGAVAQALLEGPDRTFAAVLGGELLLDLRDLLDRFFEIAAPRLAALEDARLVEVNVGLDEAGADEASADVQDLRVRRDVRFHGRDPAVLDADVEWIAVGACGNACVSQNEVHGFSRGAAFRPARLVTRASYPKPPKRAVSGAGFPRNILVVLSCSVRLSETAQVGVLERWILANLGRGPFVDDPARFQNIASIRHRQGEAGHLVHEQDGDPFVAQLDQHVEEIVDEGGGESEGRLVEQQDSRLPDEAAGNGEHLLLAAREQAGPPRGAGAELREAFEHRFHLDPVVEVTARIGPETDVVHDAQLGKHLPAFRHEHEPRARGAVRGKRGDVVPAEPHSAQLGPMQSGHGSHQGRLPRAVRAEHRDHFPIAQGKVDVLEDRRPRRSRR